MSRQSYFGIKLNIPDLKDVKSLDPSQFTERLSKTASRFGNLAKNYEDLEATYTAGLTEGVIEGGKLGIKKGIELTEEEAKHAVKDYQQKIAAQAKKVVQQQQQLAQQAQQQSHQYVKVIDYTVEQKNRIAFTNPLDPAEILHVNTLQDVVDELSRITGKKISDKYIKQKPFHHLSLGQWDKFVWDTVEFQAMEKWPAADPNFKDRNRYLSSKGIPIPGRVSTPVKKSRGKP